MTAKRKEVKALTKRVPRVATQKFVLRLDRFVEMYAANSQGLEMFQNSGKLEALGLLEGCRTGRFPDPLPEIPADFEPDVIAFATD